MIVNSNNNRNNNNNNDFQATFGSVNTNTQTAEATQMGSTMTMITVSPVGVPAVVPVGRWVGGSSETKPERLNHRHHPIYRLLQDGSVLLDPGVEEK